MPSEKQKINRCYDKNIWDDIAKGLCILWVVIEHARLPEADSVWIFLFHMPFFFILFYIE